MRSFRLGASLAAAVAAMGVMGAQIPMQAPIPQPIKRHRRRGPIYEPTRTKTTWHTPHGQRERDRRRRQIARGQLKAENGLVLP